MTDAEMEADMFNLKRMALVAGLLTLALTSSAEEWPTDDRDLDLSPLKALPIGTSGKASGRLKFAQPTAVEPMAAAFFAENLGGGAQPAANGEQGQEVVIHKLESAAIGFGLAEQGDDYKIGEYLSLLPTDDPADIDWEKTLDGIRVSEAFRDGSLIVNRMAEDYGRRILFTRGGLSVEVVWHFKDAGVQAMTNVYQIGEISGRRPYRLFWTEHPFNAPAINLSGKNVRLLGDPAIVNPMLLTNETSKTVSVLKGVDIDIASHTLRAYAYEKEKGVWDGPKGQFVLAYYRNGDCDPDDLINAVVVEVIDRDVKLLEASVGDELRPGGDGWATEGLYPFVQSGAVEEQTDPNSPYVEPQTFTDAKSGEKVQCVYAVAPNDATSTGSGLDEPWRVDIYWETPDPMGTLWPFEEAWYAISWPGDIRHVVYDEKGEGLGILVPTNYTVTLCNYQSPCETATVSGQEVSCRKSGYFTLKLMEGVEKTWYVPFVSLRNDDVRVVNANRAYDATVRVGSEVLPLLDETEGGTAESSYAEVDETLSGYIYEQNSAAKNWNPRLYHEPKIATLEDSVPDLDSMSGEAESDPFAALRSSVYAVSASEKPIEMWWRGSVVPTSRYFAAPGRIEYPSVVQRYRAVWPKSGEVPEIVLASQLGSAGESFSEAGVSVLWNAANDRLSYLKSDLDCGTDGDWEFGFWANALAEGVGIPAKSDGRLATLRIKGGNEVTSLSCFVDVNGNAYAVKVMTNGMDAASVAIPVVQDAWTRLSFAFKVIPGAGGGRPRPCVAALQDGEIVASVEIDEATCASLFSADVSELSFGRSGGEPAALGVAIGDPSVSTGLAWVFEPDAILEDWDETGEQRVPYIADTTGHCYLVGTVGVRMHGRGTPKWTVGTPVGGIVPAEVYRQTDRTKVGYHCNLAHAFTASSDGNRGFVTWALRNDLADPYGEGLVFTMYEEDGKGRMSTHAVTLTNEVYRDFASTVTVGKQILPPKPFCLMDGYWNASTTWSALGANNGEDKTIVYRDRKLNDWAKRDGGGYAFYHYKVREDFDWPDGEVVPAGSCVPWLAGLGWYWAAEWPTPETVPTMRVGQTLTKAQAGLPEVWNMASCAVIYPSPANVSNIVDLIDPVTAQCVPLAVKNDFPGEYGFTVGNSGTTMLRDGKYYFTGLPPSVSDRFCYDPNAVKGRELQLIGKLVEPATGNPYLQLNVLTVGEARELKGICKLPTENANKKNWDAAIDALAAKQPIRPSSLGTNSVAWSVVPLTNGATRCVTNVLTRLQTKARYPGAGTLDVSNAVTEVWCSGTSGFAVARNAQPDYSPVSNYALMANGNDAGYVTIVENDNPDTSVVSEGLPVNLQVIRVVPELYAGTIRPLTDPLNKLSEMLTVQYNEPFGPASENFFFQWRRNGPNADGTVNTDYGGWQLYAEGSGLTSFVLGTNGTSLAELVNKYYVMRYRANAGTLAYETVGGDWGVYTDHTLAEGWVQRVLNVLTPFAQRVEDFYSNPSDIWYTMFEQIGGPYRGDVALNNANLTEVGLLELYQTIFNKAEKMSVANGVKDLDVNKQLLLAASRIADFYMLLGAEAYADAKNPLVEQTSVDGLEASVFALPSSTFCFQNQVRTLLDEELALLRGRTCANQPNMTTQPVFNRLLWNFTKGITEGEVAYVNNYGIRATDGVLTVDQAAKQYPQGHGDAWGHYLSAITGYYRLLRNQNFAWEASMMEMIISQSVVNNDDADEQKFADAALKLAQTGLDAMDLTVRKAWRDNAGDPMAAYGDGASVTYEKGKEKLTVRQGFGYGQWAVRAGLGGIYNWAVVNSLLPTNGEPAAVYADKGLRQITRATATQLASLCDTVNAIQQKVNTFDAGLNPLGLDQNAIPMDIDPDELAAKNSHFDQLLARTERALENCGTVLAYANRYGARLKQIQNAETDAIAAAEAQEREYTKELIELYGKPYAGDIGPGGLYAQGYDGPDLYHYMWMDTSTYVGTDTALGGYEDTSLTFYVQKTGDSKRWKADLNPGESDKTVKLHFEFDRSGILKLPDNMGSRAYEGRFQNAYRTYLRALKDYASAKASYDNCMKQFQVELSYIVGLYSTKTALGVAEKIYATVKLGIQTAAKSTETALELNEIFSDIMRKTYDTSLASISGVSGAGMTVVLDPSAVANAAMAGAVLARTSMTGGQKVTFSTALKAYEVKLAWIDWAFSMANYGVKLYEDEINTWQKVKTLCSDTAAKATAVRTAEIALNEAHVEIANLLDEGQRLQREREAVRMRISNAATEMRYMDMYNRVQRNNALTKYSASYDIAQRYVWELAKVYDYETGALSADGEAGASFLAEAIAARQLGEKGVVTDQATDKGLWDIVTRMKENWAVEKGRLGVNNPDTMTKTFSLRYELFRIRPDVSGDAAWRKELEKYWVDDLKSNADYVRFCQPLASQTTTVVKEPGLIIPFSTSINNAENFFGMTLQGGESQFSSADYVTKIHAVGVDFAGYGALTTQTADGLATEPNVYLVPAGTDYMRSPAGDRAVLGWNVVDQVMPLPYKVGSTQLDDENWIAGLDGTDGGSASGAVIRRHSTLRANGGTTSTRLVGRSVWNDRWILVIPASSLNANRVQGLETFIKGVSDIKLAIKAYSRQGN